MENASKAFIMAAGVLIAVMIASFMIFVLKKAGSMSAEYESQRSDLELVNFNSQFEYSARDNNTYFDIMTVSNMAYDVNRNNGYDANNSVQIKIIKNKKVIYSILSDKELKRNYFFEGEDNSNQTYMYDNNLLKYTTKGEDDKYNYIFNCTQTQYNQNTGKICEMQFELEEK